ncbi:MAG TPA: DUF4249 domain-containing protein [Bacteroidia bacterium]|nr:DUF4249 domain-containing protein [Bacteroidia bacterium]HRS59872.1 DUF4249 domain-containing protein [Bacteroidia bacterium]HRU68342.1 DUF4249 domain-containing protein [Bacteroidia bacterium]
MKNISLFIVIVLIISNLHFSCTKVEDIVDFPIKDPKLTLNCYFHPDSVWAFSVSRSLSVIDNANLSMVTDATIKLYENNNLLATLTSAAADQRYYFYGSKPKPGNEYKIEISHPKYKSISAVETVPQAINFNVEKFKIVDSSTYYDYWLQKSVGTLKASVNIRLSDPKGEKNYYRLICYYYDSIYGGVINQVWLESENISVEKKYPNGLLFSDKYFDGNSYEMNFKFEDYSFFSGKTYYFVLESMNAARFNYEKSIYLYWDSEGNPFSEPVQVYNNIDNGYGIFAAYNSKLLKYYVK